MAFNFEPMLFLVGSHLGVLLSANLLNMSYDDKPSGLSINNLATLSAKVKPRLTLPPHKKSWAENPFEGMENREQYENHTRRKGLNSPPS
jgi:hypothetical protein